jgi:hypothetical protein
MIRQPVGFLSFSTLSVQAEESGVHYCDVRTNPYHGAVDDHESELTPDADDRHEAGDEPSGVPPSFDPETLRKLTAGSEHLRKSLDAISTNVVNFPKIDLASKMLGDSVARMDNIARMTRIADLGKLPEVEPIDTSSLTEKSRREAQRDHATVEARDLLQHIADDLERQAVVNEQVAAQLGRLADEGRWASRTFWVSVISVGAVLGTFLLR